LTALSLIAGTPAIATSSFSNPVTQDYADAPELLIPLSDTKFVSLNVNANGSFHSSLMALDGTLVEQSLIHSYSAGTYVDINENSAWAKLPDGTLVIAWVTIRNQSGTSISTTNVAFTDDGAMWSAPIQPLPELRLDDCGIMPLCGYMSASIASDGRGNLAFSVDKVTATTQENFVTTSLNGVTWSKETSLKPESSYEHLGLIGLPNGGFVNTWTVYGQNNSSTVVYSRTIGSTHAVWIHPHVTEGGFSNLQRGIFLRTSASTVGLFFVDQNGNDSATVYRKDYSETLRQWSDAAVLVTEQFGFKHGAIQGTYISNRATVAYNLGILGSSLGKTYLTEIKNGVTQPAVMVKTDDTQYIEPMFATPFSDGTTYVGWAGQYTAPEFARYKDGVLLSTELVPSGFDRAYAKAAVSQNGNIFFDINHFNPEERRVTMVYQGATAPIARALPVIRGTAANGKKLAITLPTFLSPSGVGKTTLQWYSCSRSVPANTTVKPSTCSAISKATGSTFKVTSKQRGKFITVAIKNSNTLGTTTLFAPASSKAK
jgi:hypothetical protein